jgi:hypothetical protein
MVLTDYAENKVNDALLRGQPLGAPATWYVGLCTDLRADASAGVEPVGNAYARVAVAATLANFSGTQAPGSTTASTGTDGTSENNVTIIFPTSTGAWGNIQSVRFYDAASGGNSWIAIDLPAALNVSGAGFTLTFANGQLSFQSDN